jgi:hypothetical protein
MFVKIIQYIDQFRLISCLEIDWNGLFFCAYFFRVISGHEKTGIFSSSVHLVSGGCLGVLLSCYFISQFHFIG